jgi:enoyl-CoA hydratase/carnithine racemase
VPDCGGTTRLTRAVGSARAKELVMLGEMIDSEKAENYGLVNRIYPDDTFDAQANEFIAKVLDRPSRAMGIAKRLIDMGAGMDRMTFMDLEATMQSILITHESFMETFQSGMMKVNEMKKEASAKLRGE